LAKLDKETRKAGEKKNGLGTRSLDRANHLSKETRKAAEIAKAIKTTTEKIFHHRDTEFTEKTRIAGLDRSLVMIWSSELAT
jgi:hypothetical protein